jgi:outer membrane protein OmpA-like peptidoglycan-associated protein
MQEAQFFKTKIDASVAGREDWYYNTSESADITPTERNKLEKAITTLKKEPAATVVISGYTDTTDSAE